MNEPFEQIPDLLSVGTQALVANASRLGITWRLRLATVTELSSEDSFIARMDGDDESIQVVSMIGAQVVGARVYVITIPPAGNYAIGWVSGASSRFPGQRIETTTITTDSATFTTTETSLATVTPFLVTGRTYRIIWIPAFEITIDGIIRATIREDTISGTIINLRDVWADNTGTATGVYVEGLYTAVATGDKTFVGSGDVLSGGGTANLNAAAIFPSYFYVEYLSG